MSLQYGELRLNNVWDLLASLGHPSKFERISRLGFITAPTSLKGDERCLHDVWPSLDLVHYIHFGGSCPLTEFARRKIHFTSKSCDLAFSYIGSVTAQHSSTGRQPNCLAFSRRHHLYSARRPSRWASTHILVILLFVWFRASWLSWLFVSFWAHVNIFHRNRIVSYRIVLRSTMSTRERLQRNRAMPEMNCRHQIIIIIITVDLYSAFL